MKRFWNKVDKTEGCWNWTAATAGGKKDRYGVIRMNHPRRQMYAHRLSYEMHHGPIPDGLHVMHSCDNTLCVNPEHLRVGTPTDNARDKVFRGRAPKPNAILSLEDVREIRARLQNGELHASIAKDYPVSRVAITCINIGKTWTR